jgi:Tfp pilus assembly protein PilX
MEIQNRRRREGGAALLVAMLMLALMGLIGFASMDTVMRDRQVAGNLSLSQNALYAADAGVAAALDLLRTEIVTAALSPGDCLSGVLPNSTPLPNANGSSYGPDTTAGNQICMLASAEPCSELDASIEQGQPIFLYTVWNIQTQGLAPGGATARVQATAERCHAFNN